MRPNLALCLLPPGGCLPQPPVPPLLFQNLRLQIRGQGRNELGVDAIHVIRWCPLLRALSAASSLPCMN